MVVCSLPRPKKEEDSSTLAGKEEKEDHVREGKHQNMEVNSIVV